MVDLKSLESCIYKIGCRMVRCNKLKLNCEGIRRDVNEGILPRCLILESERREGKGVIIIGINPGRGRAIARKDEQEYYKKNPSYETEVSYWRKNIAYKHYYYTRLRRLADQISLKGPILWTELVKCENKQKGKLPPLQTFRTCVDRYLKKELKLIDKDWPLIAVGREAYKAVAYIFVEYTVLGIPHTNSWGNFANLFCKDGLLKKRWKKKTEDFLKNSKGKAAWLPDL